MKEKEKRNSKPKATTEKTDKLYTFPIFKKNEEGTPHHNVSLSFFSFFHLGIFSAKKKTTKLEVTKNAQTLHALLMPTLPHQPRKKNEKKKTLKPLEPYFLHITFSRPQKKTRRKKKKNGKKKLESYAETGSVLIVFGFVYPQTHLKRQ